MYTKLKQLLLEALSGATRAAIKHRRNYMDAINSKGVDAQEKALSALFRAKDAVPTTRKGNNRRIKLEIKALKKTQKKHGIGRSEMAKIAKSDRAHYKKTQID